ncbi:hypothetical protein KIN20_003678 [Parelaphostrongylus tenuis]|uniref:Uncharacterized protein n=1 Tax=Parelaphostrongylus tenuis TaxID=148309 RepID=A0AAD5QG81_PARTN|nr:hypothetical protein KIN20_003678 [Parelaphostrongylus tenuis]
MRRTGAFVEVSSETKMNILTNMIGYSISPLFLISFPATISAVFGCGVMPAGQTSTRTFTVTGFTTLPIAMVYAGKPDVSNKVSGIATSEAGAKGFVERLVRQTVFDVLESQGRSALLPDAVISGILAQLLATVTYEPMKCQEVILDLANDMTATSGKASVV